jgi:phospholipid/cholesterol/gamma-HCH transport system substrate-binding protein
LRLDRVDPNRVIAHIRVEGQTPVRTDSVAQLNFQGITGVTFIQILAGDPATPLLTSVNGETPQIRPAARSWMSCSRAGKTSWVSQATQSARSMRCSRKRTFCT